MSEVTDYEWLIEVFLLHRRTKIQPLLPRTPAQKHCKLYS